MSKLGRVQKTTRVRESVRWGCRRKARDDSFLNDPAVFIFILIGPLLAFIALHRLILDRDITLNNYILFVSLSLSQERLYSSIET